MTSTSGVLGVTSIGDGGSTNYAKFNATGDLSFVGTGDTITGPGAGGLTLTNTSGNISLTTVTSGDINFTAAGTSDFIFNADADSLFTLDSSVTDADNIVISPYNAGTGTFTGTLTSADLTGTQTWTLPDASGAICLDSNNCGYALGTNYWQAGTEGIAPYNLTLDTYFGGTATASAQLRIAGIETTGGNILDINSDTITTGTVADINSSSLISGELLKLSTTGNTFTTGQLWEVSSTATSLTSGNLGLFDWSPSTWATASGDLVKINIGQYGDTTGNLFAIYDNSSELFSVDTTKITSALPHEFTAAGDVTVAYDLVFTNQTASTIDTYGPLTIQAGESFENNNLTLKTFGTGDLIFDNDGATTVILTDDG